MSSISTVTGLTPELPFGVGTFGSPDLSAFAPFSETVPSSPAPLTFSVDALHEELFDVHPEVLSSDFSVVDASIGSSPAQAQLALSPTDARVPDMDVEDVDGQHFEDLLTLVSEKPTPEWAQQAHDDGIVKVKAEAQEEVAAVKQEAVEEKPLHLPSLPKTKKQRGKMSRKKEQEEIRDEIDLRIYSLIPKDKLELPRKEFLEWRESSGMPALTVSEQKRLAKIRRMILARVYAERTRLRKIAEAEQSGHTLSRLKQENASLRKKAAKLESTQAKLRAQVKRLLAAQKIVASRHA